MAADRATVASRDTLARGAAHSDDVLVYQDDDERFNLGAGRTRDGKFIELVGNYDPKKPGDNANIDLSRIDYWINNGARPSDTVRSIIKKARRKEAAAVA